MIPRLANILVAIFVLAAGFVTDAGAAGGPKDIVLVLDNSGSMKKNDPAFLTGVAVREFLDRLEGDNRVAILLFDQSARLVMPLTPLTEATRPDFLLSLDKVDYRGLLTDSPAAIERAIYELKVNGRPGADKSIVFMTDGIVDTGDKAMDVEKSRWMREELSSEAADENIRIFGIAFTENADFLLIQSIAKKTSGEYFRAYSASDIDGVFRRVIQVLDRPKPAKVVQDAPQTALPEPLITLPETTLPETGTGTATSLPEVSEPAMGVTQAPSVEAESTSASSSTETGPTAPATGAGELPTLSLPQLDTPASSETQASADTSAAPADTPEAASPPEPEPQPEMQPTKPPPPPAPAPAAPASGLPLPLPILVAVGTGVLVLLIAVVLLVKRKSAKTEPAGEQIPKAFLNDLGGVSQQQSYELNDKLTIVGRIAGTDPENVNYVVIEEPTIGRRHAMIEFKDHSFWVIDQSSLNGTFVNNKRIDTETRLKHGDRLRFHKHEFEFLLLDMFETDRTMMSSTMFADMSSEIEDQDVTQARPSAADPAEEDGSEKTTANPGAK